MIISNYLPRHGFGTAEDRNGDITRFDDDVPDGEDQPVLVDDDTCALSLGSQRRSGRTMFIDIGMQADDGGTALMIAAFGGQEACVKALLRAKANTELLDNDGVTALR